jgi:hydrocephalus-inducing protein
VFSDRKLTFKYKWEKDVPFAPIAKTLEMTSGSALPLNFSLKVVPPYFVDQENIILQPGKAAKVRVDFDPSFKSDRVSGVLNGKITVVHNDHPHR